MNIRESVKNLDSTSREYILRGHAKTMSQLHNLFVDINCNTYTTVLKKNHGDKFNKSSHLFCHLLMKKNQNLYQKIQILALASLYIWSFAFSNYFLKKDRKVYKVQINFLIS